MVLCASHNAHITISMHYPVLAPKPTFFMVCCMTKWSMVTLGLSDWSPLAQLFVAVECHIQLSACWVQHFLRQDTTTFQRQRIHCLYETIHKLHSAPANLNSSSGPSQRPCKTVVSNSLIWTLLGSHQIIWIASQSGAVLKCAKQSKQLSKIVLHKLELHVAL